MRTKVASFFIFFQELSSKKKIKALRPKMTKIASRGGPALKPLVAAATGLANRKLALGAESKARSWGGGGGGGNLIRYVGIVRVAADGVFAERRQHTLHYRKPNRTHNRK